MKATAIMHVRNEQEILRRCFDHLLENGVCIAVIDNESDDSTSNIIDSYSSSEVVLHETLEFDGTLNLPNLLRALEQAIPKLDAAWIVYQGADEILQSIRPGERLIQGIERLDASGFSAINFNEFVFVPTRGWFGYEGKDFVFHMRYYYFFQPYYPRLMRAWKNLEGISNFYSGGHLLKGGQVKLADEDWILRHYIVRSYRQARLKYRLRRHSAEAVAKGWHGNRININWDKVRLPPRKHLKHLPMGTGQFDTSDPWEKHFWEKYCSWPKR